MIVRRPSILLVEDHADTRLMYVEFLRDQYDVREAADGVAALEAIRERVPDLVVTDLSLPRLDGFELIARIRADEKLRGLPLIALSGYSGTEHEARVKALGPSSVLQKPCLPDTLLGTIAKYLAKTDE